MGVFWPPPSCFMNVGVATRGLRSSEGYEADSGVFNAESWGFCVAAMIEEQKRMLLRRRETLLYGEYTEEWWWEYSLPLCS